MPDFTIFSSLLWITVKYELPTVQSQLLGLIRDAYPETFEGLVPSKPLGESAFSGPTPHLNEVLDLFLQQKLTSTLPMAYYMTARRGLGSLMNLHHHTSMQLPPETLQTAVGGLMALHEMELKEVHCLITVSHRCVPHGCVSPKTLGPGVLDVECKVIDRTPGLSQARISILQVCWLNNICGSKLGGPCKSCEYAEVRNRVWDALPGVFGLMLRV